MINTASGSFEASQQEMDAEHRMQVELATALRDAVASGADRAQVDELLDRLVDYTDIHFMSEQSLMRLYSYPDYDGHVQEHERAIERLQELRESVRDGDVAATVTFAESLRTALTAHIGDADRAFEAFLADHRIASG